MTGPVRDLFKRATLRTGEPAPEGRPECWRDRESDNGKACALTYTPKMQQDLLKRSPGCAGCWAGINSAALYYQYKGCKL